MKGEKWRKRLWGGGGGGDDRERKKVTWRNLKALSSDS